MTGGFPLLAVAAVVLAGCAAAGTPTDVPSATNFTAPTVTDAAAAERVQACERLADRDDEVRCLIPVAEDLLAAAYAPVVRSRGLEFTRPTVVLDGADTDCGRLERVAYCPRDATLVLPLDQAAALGDRAASDVEWGPRTLAYFAGKLTEQQRGAGGAYGAIMALAHEYGHHVQTLLGYEQINTAEMTSQPDHAAAYSSEFELMADCFAGWTAAVLHQGRSYPLTAQDQWAAITALAEVGDDFVEDASGAGRQPPATFNHGAAGERANIWIQGAGIGFDGDEPYVACLAAAQDTIAARGSAAPTPSR